MKPFKDFWKGLTGGFTSGELDFTKIKDIIVSFVKPIVDTFRELVGSIDFEAVGTRIREWFMRIKNFVTGVWESLTTGGGLEKAQENFKIVFDIVKEFANSMMDAINVVDWKALGMSLGRSLRTIFSAIQDIFQPVMDKAGPIFKQIGSEMGPLFKDLNDIAVILFGYIEDIIKVISNILVPLITPIVNGIMEALIPFWNGFRTVIKIIKAILSGDFASIPNLLKEYVDNFVDMWKSLIKGLWEGVQTLFSPSKWFDGVGDKKSETTTQAAPNTQAAASQNQGAIDKLANDWAYSVYTNKATLAQVPKDALAKVQDILKNPPGNWKSEVNKTQQQNSTPPKTETQTAQNSTKPAEKKEEKPAATPAVDLNNKDALVVLKTMADYQRRTIDAVNNLNGNILKKA
jgi:hypothetical protein